MENSWCSSSNHIEVYSSLQEHLNIWNNHEYVFAFYTISDIKSIKYVYIYPQKHICHGKLGHYWFWKWLAAQHIFKQCSAIVHYTHETKVKQHIQANKNNAVTEMHLNI